jgi:hypothetical protein
MAFADLLEGSFSHMWAPIGSGASRLDARIPWQQGFYQGLSQISDRPGAPGRQFTT